MAIIDLLRNQRLLYLLGGFLLGLFVGFRILPVWFPAHLPEEKEQLALQHEAVDLANQVEDAIADLSFVKTAKASLSLKLDRRSRRYGEAILTVDFASKPSASQIKGLTTVAAGIVDGLDPGQIIVVDVDGNALNLKAVQEHEQKLFWTGIAINVAKILGILAALITMKYVIRAVGRGVGSTEE